MRWTRLEGSFRWWFCVSDLARAGAAILRAIPTPSTRLRACRLFALAAAMRCQAESWEICHCYLPVKLRCDGSRRDGLRPLRLVGSCHGERGTGGGGGG